ncbi:MAG: methyltransferase domain-containing protein [archaeon]
MGLKGIYKGIFKTYEDELKKAVGNSSSLLDVGCGSNSPIHPFSKNLSTVGVDDFFPSIEKSKQKQIHNAYKQINVLEINKNFDENSFDCVLASDLIEHLTKEEGNKLIDSMEKIAKKKVIIFTPNGFLHQGEYDNNAYQIHKSGWTAEEMKKRGYKVIGINGWKQLRGEFTNIKYKPTFVWRIISDLTQLITRNNPKKAFQILCIKNTESF